MTEKLMKLINPRTGEMECRVCGATHYSAMKPLAGEIFYRKDWECRNGCRTESGKS